MASKSATRDHVGVEPRRPFAGRAEADAAGRPAGQRHQAGAQQPLQIDDQIEPQPPQVSARSRNDWAAPPQTAARGAAVEGQRLVEVGMAAQQIGVGPIDDPADVGVREAAAQGGQDGQAVNDVAEGARLEQDDAAGVDFSERRQSPAGHDVYVLPSAARGRRAETRGSLA